MIRILKFIAVAMALTVALAMPVHAQQAKKGPPKVFKIAIIDIEAIRRDAVALKDARQQVAKYQASFQAEIQKEESALRTANQELARQRSILSPEAFNEERRKFEQRLIEVQRKVQQRKQQLDELQLGVMQKMNEAMAEVVGEIATEDQYTVILRLDQAVFAADTHLITKKVLDRLNKKLPTIKVSEPQEAAEPAKPAAGKK